MVSKKILTEDDLLIHYMQNYIERKDRFFPKVHTISTLPISPDIDLLLINKESELVVGREFKLLKYREGWKRVNYNPMYSGIGEALLYFQYGIDKCYLVLGLAEMPSNWIDTTLEKIDQAIENFNILTKLFTNWSKQLHECRTKKNEKPIVRWFLERHGLGDSEEWRWGFGCFGIMVWNERDGLKVKKNADQHFPVSRNPDLKHKKECLLREEFKYKKSFLDKVVGNPKQREEYTKEVRLKPKYTLE